VEIFVEPSKAESFLKTAGHSQGAGDLDLLLTRSAGQTDKNDVFLGIDVVNSKFTWHGANAQPGAPQKSTGRIVSVPDLAGATAIIYFCPRGYRDEAEREEFAAVASKLELLIFGLVFSGGQRIYLKPEMRVNEYGERVYVVKFPPTPAEVKALTQK
jgi:hypothetical protein